MKYCFISSMFRSGSTFLSRMLGVHPSVASASDPMRPLLNSFRYEISDNNYRSNHSRFDPLDDYFLDNTNLLRDIFATDFDRAITIPCAELLRVIYERALNFSGLWAESLDLNKNFNNYMELIEYLFHQINTVYGQDKNTEYICFKEVWSSEFFPVFKRLFPNMKCIALVRDPRGVVASKDITGSRYPYFFMGRQWRKLAWINLYLSSKYEDDVLLLRYEDFVNEPEIICSAICHFLNIDFFPNMLDMSCYVDGWNKTWERNTSYSDINKFSIDNSGVYKWKSVLSKNNISSLELITFDWMNELNYIPVNDYNSLKTLNFEDYTRFNQNELAEWILPYSFDQDFSRLFKEFIIEKMRLSLINNSKISERFELQFKWW